MFLIGTKGVRPPRLKRAMDSRMGKSIDWAGRLFFLVLFFFGYLVFAICNSAIAIGTRIRFGDWLAETELMETGRKHYYGIGLGGINLDLIPTGWLKWTHATNGYTHTHTRNLDRNENHRSCFFFSLFVEFVRLGWSCFFY